MSLLPVIIREPDESDVTDAERLIYRTFIGHIEDPTSVLRAVIRTARDCGVSRHRVAQVIRKVNPEWPT